MWAVTTVCIVGGYLVGSIPFGLLAGWMKGMDIRKHGSGNIGATNVGRVLGKRYGLAVFALDLLKGLIPVVVAGEWLYAASTGASTEATRLWAWLGVGGACILGHMFPVYLRFKGGKGVATSLGVILGFYPYFTWPGLVAFGLWILLTGSTGYVSVGSMVAAGAFPILFAIFASLRGWASGGYLWPLYVFAAAIGILVIYRHRGNLRRLMQGVEPKISLGRGRTTAKREL
jgi:acyl phosphate:glycerol-3-phosphate acyltransferase